MAEKPPRASWLRVRLLDEDGKISHYSGVLRIGQRIIWRCMHAHPSPNGYNVPLDENGDIPWSAMDCALKERARRADEKATPGTTSIGGT